MTAINLRDRKEYEVNEYIEDNKRVLYIEHKNQECSFEILEESKDFIDNIEYGMKYRHYLIDNKLYESFWSNAYKPFAKEISKYKQQRLF